MLGEARSAVEAGEPGVISGYLAPEAGPLLAKLAEEGGAIPAEALGDPDRDRCALSRAPGDPVPHLRRRQPNNNKNK